MSEDVLETVRATVQEFLAPEIRTHSVKLDGLGKRLEDTKKSLEQRIEDSKSSLQHQITDTKGTLRAEMRTLQSRFEILEVRFGSLEEWIRAWGAAERVGWCVAGAGGSAGSSDAEAVTRNQCVPKSL